MNNKQRMGYKEEKTNYVHEGRKTLEWRGKTCSKRIQRKETIYRTTEMGKKSAKGFETLEFLKSKGWRCFTTHCRHPRHRHRHHPR